MCVASFFTLITPVCVEAGGAPALIVLRILIGLGEGVIFPSCAALLASWTPLTERGKIGTLTYSGAQIGSIIGSLVSGWLLGAYPGYGSVFYFFGAFGLVWSAFFVSLCLKQFGKYIIQIHCHLQSFLVYNSPEVHPWVSDKEKAYLHKELGTLNEESSSNKSVPWRALLSSPAVLSLIVAQIGHNWGFFIMVTDLPKYMNDVLKFSIKENGLYSALPYVTMFIAAQLTGLISDWLIKKKYVGITNVRKFCTAVGMSLTFIYVCLKMLIVNDFRNSRCWTGSVYYWRFLCRMRPNISRSPLYRWYGLHGPVLFGSESKHT